MHQAINVKFVRIAAVLLVLSLSACSSNSGAKADKAQQEQSPETDTSTNTKEVIRPLEVFELVPNKAALPKPPVKFGAPNFGN